MTGVEILATQEVATAFGFNWSAFWIVFGITAGFMVVLGLVIYGASGEVSNFIACVILGLIVGLLLSASIGSNKATPTEYETQYKVTVSDEVSMNDFLERYEIVSQEGKIYTVRERND